ncbi:MAG: xanthine dehydrogenase family protein molybdopterin-binding subunit [Dehalococcoidia bacterium]
MMRDRSLGMINPNQPRPPRRVEGPEKVTGRAGYAYDIHPPGLLFARVLRSPLPHARVVRVDTSRAQALPGVRAVLSVENAPRISWYEDRSVLFDRTVRFQGDEVVAVAAESEEIAEDALRLIDVQYDPLPFVTELAAALAPDAPRVHEAGNIEGEPTVYERGDLNAGFRGAEVIVEQVYTTQTALHNAMEPHGCMASWEGDHLTIWSSTQSVFEVREKVAESLGLAQNRVRVIMQYMGGGFGAKGTPWKHDVIASLLSRQAGRPVQLMLDREAENLAAGNRNPTRQHVRLGARRDETLSAIFAHTEQAIGAYMLGGEGSDVTGAYQLMYRCPNVRTEQVMAYTNTGPASAFRAPGYVEGMFALESAMDELARELQIDPLELRRRNYTTEDQVQNKPYTTDALRVLYDRAAGEFGWSSYRQPQPQGTKRRGAGMAANVWIGGSGWPPAYAWLKLNGDGTADVITGTQDIGTGTRTGLSQIAAEELGLPLERVALRLGDTQSGLYAPVSSGSATQASLGPAIQQAAVEVKRQLIEKAAGILETKAERLQVRDGQIWEQGLPEPQISVEEVCSQIAPEMIQASGSREENPKDKAVRTFGVQFVEVEVDIETGEVTILRLVTSQDAGRIINPTLADSQVIGGITQGYGFALTEERVIDHRFGIVLNADLEEYKLPTVADAPPVSHAQVSLPDFDANPTGAKGIGEPPLVPTAPAIANAVFDATGIRIRDLPLTRWRLLDEGIGDRG